MESRPLINRILVESRSQARMLLQRVPASISEPVRRAHAGALAEFKILVGRDGTVLEVTPAPDRERLPEELLRPLVSAVRDWRYRPTLLNGNPVEVCTTVEIEIQQSS